MNELIKVIKEIRELGYEIHGTMSENLPEEYDIIVGYKYESNNKYNSSLTKKEDVVRTMICLIYNDSIVRILENAIFKPHWIDVLCFWKASSRMTWSEKVIYQIYEDVKELRNYVHSLKKDREITEDLLNRIDNQKI